MIIMQGFALSALWSLTEASMVLALEATRAPVVATLFHALLLSLIGFVLGLLFFLHRARRGGLTFDPARLHSTFDGSARQAWRLIAQFFVILIGFLSTILASLFVIKMSIIDVVPLSILLWTFIYFLYKRELGTLYDRLKRYLTKDIGQRSRELSFILSSGLMIAALVETGWGEQLFLFIMEAEKIPFINMLLLLPLMIVLFGLVGMPPVPSMVLLTAVLMRLPLEYSATELVLSLLLGNMVTFLLSPVTMPTLLLSSLNHLSTLTNGLRSNFAYAFVFFIVAPLYIQLLHRWELG